MQGGPQSPTVGDPSNLARGSPIAVNKAGLKSETGVGRVEDSDYRERALLRVSRTIEPH